MLTQRSPTAEVVLAGARYLLPLALAALAIGADFIPMSRELLLEMPFVYQGIRPDNIEAISWGSTRANGNRTLVLVSDNNFSPSQANQFIAFEVVPALQNAER